MTDHVDTATEREKIAGLAGHTPGPWKNRGSATASVTTFQIHSQKGCRASVYGRNACADADLIAAAPDLLATVHRLLDALDAERARAEKAEAEVERLRSVLNDIYENVEYWNTLRISSKIRAALQRKEGNE